MLSANGLLFSREFQPTCAVSDVTSGPLLNVTAHGGQHSPVHLDTHTSTLCSMHLGGMNAGRHPAARCSAGPALMRKQQAFAVGHSAGSPTSVQKSSEQ